jgi:hypothetical protein
LYLVNVWCAVPFLFKVFPSLDKKPKLCYN